MIRVFDYPGVALGALSRVAGNLVRRNPVLNCIELPAEQFRALFVIPYSVSTSEALDEYIKCIKEEYVVKVPGEDYWQSLIDKITLRPFQIEYLQWLESRRLLAYPPKGSQTGVVCQLDQGLGKTITAIVTDLHFRKLGLVKNTVIVCRNNNKYSTWVTHLEEFTNLSYVVIEGNRQKRLKQFDEVAKADVGIAHYEAARLHEKELLALGTHHVIIDEAQRIANYLSKQSKTLNAFTETAFWTSLLSGGVAQNRVETQLWHPLHICDRKKWPTFVAWKQDWCILEELWIPLRVRGKIIFDRKTHEPIRRRIYTISGIKNRPKLSGEISPYIFQKSKRDVVEQLPPKIYQVIETGLHKEQLRLYKEVRDDIADQVKGVSIPTALTRTLRLLQVCATLGCFNLGDISRKADEAAEVMFDIVPDDGKALVFSQFVPMCEAVHRRLLDMEAKVLLLTGKVRTDDEKNAIRERFREGGEQFLVTTIQLEGEGGSYPKAPFVFRLDRTHVPLKNMQCEDRAHRLTSEYDVLHVVDFVTLDSMEQEQIRILTEKMSSIKGIMDLAQLYTMEDIKRMLSVTPRAE